MIRKTPDELTCDMAETYGVFDIHRLPARLAATLAVGLRDDSRAKRKLSNTPVTDEIILLAHIADCVRWLRWMNTKDAQDGGDPPELLINYYLGIEPEKNRGFETPEDFKAEWQRITEG